MAGYQAFIHVQSARSARTSVTIASPVEFVSRYLIPHAETMDLKDEPPPGAPPSAEKARTRTSSACLMCQKRKIKCNGLNPCENCQRRNWSCRYDALSDGRKKTVHRENLQQLHELRRQLDHQRRMIAGLIATIRAGGHEANNRLVQSIRSIQNMTQLAASIQGEVQRDSAVQNAYEEIDLTWTDSPLSFPSIGQLLDGPPLLRESEQQLDGIEEDPHDSDMTSMPDTDVDGDATSTTLN